MQIPFYSSKISIFIKNLKMIKYILIPFLVLGFLTSCSDSELITPGDEYFPPGMLDGSYTVNIDGVFTDFSTQTTAINNSASSQINGTNQTNGTISIMIPQSLSVGTYDQLDGAMIAISMPDGVYVNSNLTGPLPFMLNITQLSSGKVSGLFSGQVFNMATGQTKELSNGSFVKIIIESTPGGDAILKANFDGQTIDFSSNAKAEGIVSAALISGTNPIENQELSITIPGGISVNTYTEEDEVEIKVNLGTSGNPADNYSNFNPTDGTYLPVTLKITGISEGENGMVTGTFSGSIAKYVNGVPTNTVQITGGQIKVPIVTP